MPRDSVKGWYDFISAHIDARRSCVSFVIHSSRALGEDESEAASNAPAETSHDGYFRRNRRRECGFCSLQCVPRSFVRASRICWHTVCFKQALVFIRAFRTDVARKRGAKRLICPDESPNRMKKEERRCE